MSEIILIDIIPDTDYRAWRQEREGGIFHQIRVDGADGGDCGDGEDG